jgi:uncharacterized protein YegP (UPF0339 family)
MRFHVYKDTAGYLRWRLLAGNNKTIADSGEGYHNKQDCLHAIGLITGTAKIPVYEV